MDTAQSVPLKCVTDPRVPCPTTSSYSTKDLLELQNICSRRLFSVLIVKQGKWSSEIVWWKGKQLGMRLTKTLLCSEKGKHLAKIWLSDLVTCWIKALIMPIQRLSVRFLGNFDHKIHVILCALHFNHNLFCQVKNFLKNHLCQVEIVSCFFTTWLYHMILTWTWDIPSWAKREAHFWPLKVVWQCGIVVLVVMVVAVS